MKKRQVLLTFAVLMFVFLTGCTLDIKEDVDFPADVFKQTMKKIDALQAKYPGRKGPVTNLNMLVYVGEERKLISMSIPTEGAKDALKAAAQMNLGGSGKDDKMKQISKGLKGIDLDKLELLEKLGPGLVAEIEVKEKKEEVFALVWLD